MDLVLYTDGSYSKSVPDITTGGMVVLYNDQLVAAQRYITKWPCMVSMNNVGGELLAAVGGLFVAAGFLQQVAPNQNHTITLMHDYKGIKDFAEGKWSAKKAGSVYYVQSINVFKKNYPNITLNFIKVKAHSGNKWNDVVDAIANGINPLECKGKMMDDFIQEK